MKLSFSTKGWHNNSFDEFCDIAVELGFGGIELHNVNNRLFTDKDGAFHDYTAAATVRRLYEKKLNIKNIEYYCKASFEKLYECCLNSTFIPFLIHDDIIDNYSNRITGNINLVYGFNLIPWIFISLTI